MIKSRTQAFEQMFLNLIDEQSLVGESRPRDRLPAAEIGWEGAYWSSRKRDPMPGSLHGLPASLSMQRAPRTPWFSLTLAKWVRLAT
jgi:hypothetical protein